MHDWIALKEKIRAWGRELDLAAVGFAGVALGAAEVRLTDWLAAGCHGTMDYMARHGAKRARPAELAPGTRCVITCRMDYLPEVCRPASADPIGPPRSQNRLAAPHRGGVGLGRPGADFAEISRYALGRDYHKLLRNRLQKLADRITAEVGAFGYRALVDSAPVMEVELAQNAGLGWRGKHTLLLSQTGSWFFLGELFVDLPLPADGPIEPHCGTCTACLDICPTQAFIAPWRLDARRCISYLTIEHPGSIPEELRSLMGNRIYGCDDCQIVCPWNRFAPPTREADFLPRNGLDRATLADLFSWTAADFNDRLAGSPIRRIGHERWLRNIAVALGNAAPSEQARAALLSRADCPSALVREHVGWALSRYPG
ncbi:MAG: tRNA epoxyqueuosine(34) reductase QueG [Sulfuritalea sp.]|nr:tRNA epoxyqueuosine(34) reductase QueG [Sulfuritalea sp.]